MILRFLHLNHSEEQTQRGTPIVQDSAFARSAHSFVPEMVYSFPVPFSRSEHDLFHGPAFLSPILTEETEEMGEQSVGSS